MAKEKIYTRDYQNISGGMLVTTLHEGSGNLDVIFVPGTYALKELDEDSNEVSDGKIIFAGTLEARAYQSRIAKRNIAARKKASKGKK